MTNKLIFISLGSLLLTFATGWEIAMITKTRHNLNTTAIQALPVIRFERFDKSRNALIIGLFNPGTSPMEINRTELSYQVFSNRSRVKFNAQNYTDKVLVLDPGDTILVPLQKSVADKSLLQVGNYWGKLDFKIPGRTDFFSLHHRFSQALYADKTILTK